MPPRPTLIQLPYSPWSERARWVLAHHRIDHESVEHQPFLGEFALRRRAGFPSERVSVPLMLTGQELLRDSWAIADFADREGTGTPLLPSESRTTIREVHDELEHVLQAGRCLLVAAMLEDTPALSATLPSFTPSFLRGALLPMTRFATRWFARKYALPLEAREAQTAVLRAALTGLRARLNGAATLFGSFSYADILWASTLQCVRPVADQHWPLDPALRRVNTRAELASEFSDLLEWRDQIYDHHRPPPP